MANIPNPDDVKITGTGGFPGAGDVTHGTGPDPRADHNWASHGDRDAPGSAGGSTGDNAADAGKTDAEGAPGGGSAGSAGG